MTNHLNLLSEELLLNVKMQKDTHVHQQKLKELGIENLQIQLASDDNKKAFWINIYNAYYQILRKEKNVTKSEIYKDKLFEIAGIKLSLDDVEHGILRKNKYKYSLGFMHNMFSSKFIKNHMVEELDYRIHFALNCGAKSCPPIAFYKVKNINDQLDLATQSFLESESIFDDIKKEAEVTSLFKWFYADFGCTAGIKKIFTKQLHKDISDYKIIYNEYSWEEDLGNFAP